MKKIAVAFLTVCLVACMAISGAWASEATGYPSMAGTWAGTVAAMNLDITFTLDAEGAVPAGGQQRVPLQRGMYPRGVRLT